jgi:hypothetical protein
MHARATSSQLDGMALVMTDVLLGGHYLTGYYLGELMRKMVKDKELRITLVLDSCHSGAGWRADDVPEGLTPRTVLKGELDGTWLSADEVADEPAIEIINTDMEPAAANRNPGAGRKSSWLTDPSNCTVVTACGAGQVAGERTFGSNSLWQGILTHWVVGIVGRFVGRRLPSHAYVLDHAQYGIISMGSKAKQTPLLFGEGLCEFFGSFAYFERAPSFVLRRRGQTIDLDIGAAQGVASGALYDLTRNNEEFKPGQDELRLQARVTEVREFTSTAELQDNNEEVGLGWLVVLRRWAFDPPVSIKFLPDQESTRAALDRELHGTPGLALTTNPKVEGAITIQVGGDDSYEILWSGRRLSRLPRISLKDEFASKKLAYVVSHVARFHALRDHFLRQTSQYLREADFCFSVQPQEVEDEASVTVCLEYKGQVYERVWCSLVCFTASWGVVKLDPKPEFGKVANEARRGRPLEAYETDMAIPPKSRPDDPDDIEDTFVVFVSSGDSRPVSWGDICLPSLPVDDLAMDQLLDIKRSTDEAEKDAEDSKRSTFEDDRDPGGSKAAKAKGTQPGITRWTVLDKVVRTSPK